MDLLNWRGTEETIAVGMISNLGEDLILGTDYVNFTPLLEKACQENIANVWWDEAPFGTTEIDARPLRKKLSRKEKREQRQKYLNPLTPETSEPVPQTATVLTIAGSFRQTQREDPTLKNAWQQALHPDGRSTGRRRTAKTLATLQEKRGTARCKSDGTILIGRGIMIQILCQDIEKTFHQLFSFLYLMASDLMMPLFTKALRSLKRSKGQPVSNYDMVWNSWCAAYVYCFELLRILRKWKCGISFHVVAKCDLAPFVHKSNS
ncbi:hypothetical protein NDU88_005533 [Pleurodeles waltl]|uniref:Uncharacterized protein n=1 Tax=Pleurodeles waltl TaxID=8319 RepID=A0AAV7L130_PLEWA|nr:hypothetical protein NDU88_005533 [Pleurodeles waltl]